MAPAIIPFKASSSRYGKSTDMEKEIEQLKNRSIRSFVLRQGRLTPAQQRAIDDAMPIYGVTYEPKILDLDTLFGRSDSAKIVEIGFGMG